MICVAKLLKRHQLQYIANTNIIMLKVPTYKLLRVTIKFLIINFSN